MRTTSIVPSEAGGGPDLGWICRVYKVARPLCSPLDFALLELVEKTMYTMAHAGVVTVSKIRGQWRTKRTRYDRWLDAQSLGENQGGRGE